ncbi:hypothetical protein DOC35_19345 [Salmonella enterica subsp. enterica]|nr:hypothetical protein [Salmonella enterica subsp. enterica]
MKNIEDVYPIAEAMAADFERERGAQLAHADRATAYLVFLELEYNYPRALTFRTLENRHEDDAEFCPQIAAEALAYFQARKEKPAR